MGFPLTRSKLTRIVGSIRSKSTRRIAAMLTASTATRAVILTLHCQRTRLLRFCLKLLTWVSGRFSGWEVKRSFIRNGEI